MPIVPDSNSATSKLGIAKWILSAACLIGGVVLSLTGNAAIGGVLIAVAAQGGVSAQIGMKAQDAK